VHLPPPKRNHHPWKQDESVTSNNKVTSNGLNALPAAFSRPEGAMASSKTSHEQGAPSALSLMKRSLTTREQPHRRKNPASRGRTAAHARRRRNSPAAGKVAKLINSKFGHLHEIKDLAVRAAELIEAAASVPTL
jgi:hypothetical protein